MRPARTGLRLARPGKKCRILHWDRNTVRHLDLFVFFQPHHANPKLWQQNKQSKSHHKSMKLPLTRTPCLKRTPNLSPVFSIHSPTNKQLWITCYFLEYYCSASSFFLRRHQHEVSHHVGQAPGIPDNCSEKQPCQRRPPRWEVARQQHSKSAKIRWIFLLAFPCWCSGVFHQKLPKTHLWFSCTDPSTVVGVGQNTSFLSSHPWDIL